MIRIFITAILYLITMFTQAQETKSENYEAVSKMNTFQVEKESEGINKDQCADYCRFQQPKFEVNKKDLTFDRR